MSKVTITIDDANPELVAVFGEKSLERIADEMGYMEMIEKSEEELPAKIEVIVNDPLTGTDMTTLQYPEGTELYKPNTQSKGEFVGYKILNENIAPRILQGRANRARTEALAEVDNLMKQAGSVLSKVAEVKVE